MCSVYLCVCVCLLDPSYAMLQTNLIQYKIPGMSNSYETGRTGNCQLLVDMKAKHWINW